MGAELSVVISVDASCGGFFGELENMFSWPIGGMYTFGLFLVLRARCCRHRQFKQQMRTVAVKRLSENVNNR